MGDEGVGLAVGADAHGGPFGQTPHVQHLGGGGKTDIERRMHESEGWGRSGRVYYVLYVQVGREEAGGIVIVPCGWYSCPAASAAHCPRSPPRPAAPSSTQVTRRYIHIISRRRERKPINRRRRTD